ncbi:hypothetical protein RQCS_61670 (plasmid) [Rhodococcus qingshengii]|nr:hypothetical protein RQCS_61670 [Rhodococcus qingshengii]
MTVEVLNPARWAMVSREAVTERPVALSAREAWMTATAKTASVLVVWFVQSFVPVGELRRVRTWCCQCVRLVQVGVRL